MHFEMSYDHTLGSGQDSHHLGVLGYVMFTRLEKAEIRLIHQCLYCRPLRTVPVNTRMGIFTAPLSAILLRTDPSKWYYRGTMGSAIQKRNI